MAVISFIFPHVLPFDSGMEQQVAQLLSTLFLQEMIATPNYHSIRCFDGSYGSKEASSQCFRTSWLSLLLGETAPAQWTSPADIFVSDTLSKPDALVAPEPRAMGKMNSVLAETHLQTELFGGLRTSSISLGISALAKSTTHCC